MEGHGILCVLIATMALTIAPVVSQRIQTVELGNSRYFVSNASPYSPQLNWFLAYQYCRTIGMELLSIGTQEEADTLTDFLIENNYMASDYWTSGNQLGSQMWLWMSSGQPFNSTWSSWAPPGAPLVKGNKGCVSQIKGIWSAQNCMDSKHFICEQTRCFYFNYVTTNRGKGVAQPTQGNSTTSLSVQRPSINNNHQSSQIRVSHRTQPLNSQPVRKQPVKRQPVRNQPFKNQPISSQLVRNQPIRNQPDNSQTIKTMSAQTIRFPTTPLLTTTSSTTSSVMPLKIMSTIFPVTEEATVIPTTLDEESNLNTTTQASTEASSVLSTLSASKEALALVDQEPQLNEIQTDALKGRPVALPRILLPPTRSFSAGRQEQVEVPEEDAPDPALMMLLSRKDPVSWA